MSRSTGGSPPRVLSEADYRALTALDWRTSHTTRIREGAGDDRLCCAYDPNPDRPNGPCWLIARLMPTQVLYRHGRREWYSEQIMVPFLIDEWRNADKTPRSIDDPRLLGEIMRCDTSRQCMLPTGNPALERARVASEKAIDDMARDDRLQKAIAKLGDECGAVYHRKLGTEGGKISTANLWRSGAGARSPTIYSGASAA